MHSFEYNQGSHEAIFIMGSGASMFGRGSRFQEINLKIITDWYQTITAQ